jgi:hypothetical protein
VESEGSGMSRKVNEIMKMRDSLIAQINAQFDFIIARLENPHENSEPITLERTLPLTVAPNIFIKTKAVAVLFGDERVEVKNWRGVCKTILQRCNESPAHHENLMKLRNRTAGKVRVFLSDKPDSMKRPLKIADDLYVESQYGNETLIHIL